MSDSLNNRIKYIPLSRIRPNHEQPRKYFDPEAMDSLTRSIERYGVISPITVRELEEDGEYELISGERRYRAAFGAGLTDIPCIILDTDGSDCAILSLLENLQREDLSFLEIAESYKKLVRRSGLSSHDLSRKIGGSPYDIKERIDLMKLDPLVRKYIRSFGLTERQAHALLHIRDKKTQIEAAVQICENSMSEYDTIKFVSDILKTGTAPGLHMGRMKDVKLLRNTLSGAVKLVRKSGMDAELKERSHDWGEEFTVIVRRNKQ